MLHLILTRLVRHGGTLFTHQQPHQHELRNQTAHILHVWSVGVKGLTSFYFPCVDNQTPLENSLNLAPLTPSQIEPDRAAGELLCLWLLSHCLPDYKWCWEISNVEVYSREHNQRTEWVVCFHWAHGHTHHELYKHNSWEFYSTYTESRWVVSRRRRFVWYVWLLWRQAAVHLWVRGCVCGRLVRVTASCPEGREQGKGY